MTQIRVDFSSMPSMLAFIRQFPDSAVFNAARAAKWQFSRGRPSVEVLLHTWETKYPHWIEYVAKGLNREYPSGPPAFAKTDLPPSFQDDAAPSFPQPLPAQTRETSATVDLSEYSKKVETAAAIIAAANPILREMNKHVARIEVLEARIIDLAKRAPLQLTVNSVKLPPIEGQHFNFPRMVKWLTLGASILLIGPAGPGKTTAALEFAKLKGLAIHCQPLTMDSFGVFGYTSPEGRIVDTEFSRAWKHGGVFLWDELSMSSADAIGALNAALANRLAPLPGVGTVPPHADFYMIGGDNSDTGASLKFAARTVLDGATLDRFIRIEWPIDTMIEERMSGGFADWLNAVREVRNYIDTRELQHVGATPRAVIWGAMALKSGALTRIEILEDTLRKGILADSWPDILKLSAVQAFLKDEENAIL
jgi:MoxR-like ATPase